MDRHRFYALFVSSLVVIAALDGVVGHSPLGRRLSQIPGQLPAAGPWNSFLDLLDLKLGDWSSGLVLLKSYLVQFGYLDAANATSAQFDAALLNAVTLYQQNFRINASGVLDAQTLAQLIKPRCGGKDVDGVNQMARNLTNGTIPSSISHLGVVSHYSFFTGKPKWDSRSLTYAFNPAKGSTSRVTDQQRNDIFYSAFAAWSAVAKLNFTRISDFQNADIRIEFDAYEHGDGEPFDGELGVLAHAFSPTDGKFHLDSDEIWEPNIKVSSPPAAIDLQSVVLHEIGHIIGLGHSGDPDSIMFPSISPLQQKQNLRQDDILGAQALYGPNPSYDPNAPLPTSDPNNQAANHALDSRRGALSSLFANLWLMVVAAIALYT